MLHKEQAHRWKSFGIGYTMWAPSAAHQMYSFRRTFVCVFVLCFPGHSLQNVSFACKYYYFWLECFCLFLEKNKNFAVDKIPVLTIYRGWEYSTYSLEHQTLCCQPTHTRKKRELSFARHWIQMITHYYNICNAYIFYFCLFIHSFRLLFGDIFSLTHPPAPLWPFSVITAHPLGSQQRQQIGATTSSTAVSAGVVIWPTLITFVATTTCGFTIHILVFICPKGIFFDS